MLNLRNFIETSEDVICKNVQDKIYICKKESRKPGVKDIFLLSGDNIGHEVFIGIYDTINHNFYIDCEYTEQYLLDDIDLSGIKNKCTIYKYKEYFNKSVKKEIRKKLAFNENNLKLSDEERNKIINTSDCLENFRGYYSFEAWKAFFTDRSIDENNIDIFYGELNDISLDMLYSIIINFNKKVNEEAIEYIESRKISLYIAIILLKEKKSELEELNKDFQANELKKIVKVFLDKSKDLFNIKVIKNEKIFTLEVKNVQVYSGLDSNISYRFISDGKEKQQFFCYNNLDDCIYLRDIVEISFGQTILYKK